MNTPTSIIDRILTPIGFGLGFVILLVSVIIGFVLMDTAWGNVFSINGWVVGVGGFLLTIGTIQEARRQISDASMRAEQAIGEANRERCRQVNAIAAHLLSADFAELRTGIMELLHAGKAAKWDWCSDRILPCRRLAARLGKERLLTKTEIDEMEEAVNDLSLLSRSLEKRKFDARSAKKLDQIIVVIDRIEARLRRETLWPESNRT